MAEIVPNVKTGKRRTKWSLMKSLNEEKAKLANSVISLIQKQAKNVREWEMDTVGSDLSF